MTDQAKPSLVRRMGRLLFARTPSLDVDEQIEWFHGANWNKNGSISKSGFLYITDRGRLIWRSARHDFPYDEWSCQVSQIESVVVVPGNLFRKASSPFAAKLRTLCVLNLQGGVQREVFPALVKSAIEEAMVKFRSV
jgi:hypothetical protein